MLLEKITGFGESMNGWLRSRAVLFLHGQKASLGWDDARILRFVNGYMMAYELIADVSTVVLAIFMLRFFYNKYGFEWMVLVLLLGMNAILIKIVGKKN